MHTAHHLPASALMMAFVLSFGATMCGANESPSPQAGTGGSAGASGAAGGEAGSDASIIGAGAAPPCQPGLCPQEAGVADPWQDAAADARPALPTPPEMACD